MFPPHSSLISVSSFLFHQVDKIAPKARTVLLTCGALWTPLLRMTGEAISVGKLFRIDVAMDPYVTCLISATMMFISVGGILETTSLHERNTTRICPSLHICKMARECSNAVGPLPSLRLNFLLHVRRSVLCLRELTLRTATIAQLARTEKNGIGENKIFYFHDPRFPESLMDRLVVVVSFTCHNLL